MDRRQASIGDTLKIRMEKEECQTTAKDGTDDTKIYPQTRKTQSPIQGKVIRFSKRRTRFFTKIFW